jgi:hypothetical protein
MIDIFDVNLISSNWTGVKAENTSTAPRVAAVTGEAAGDESRPIRSGRIVNRHVADYVFGLLSTANEDDAILSRRMLPRRAR